jgi:hypothetical protein
MFAKPGLAGRGVGVDKTMLTPSILRGGSRIRHRQEMRSDHLTGRSQRRDPPREHGDRLTADEFMRRYEAMPRLKEAEPIKESCAWLHPSAPGLEGAGGEDPVGVIVIRPHRTYNESGLRFASILLKS